MDIILQYAMSHEAEISLQCSRLKAASAHREGSFLASVHIVAKTVPFGTCDISRNSMRLITGSADQTVKLWNVETGAQLYSFNFDSPTRRTVRDPSHPMAESALVIKGVTPKHFLLRVI